VRRTIFTEEHEEFRQMARAFLEKECVPHTAEWLEAGVVSRDAWRKAGENGLLGWQVLVEYGDLGSTDFRHTDVSAESGVENGRGRLCCLVAIRSSGSAYQQDK
jgi:long-chain-acyl-CoA dehydrogenase